MLGVRVRDSRVDMGLWVRVTFLCACLTPALTLTLTLTLRVVRNVRGVQYIYIR